MTVDRKKLYIISSVTLAVLLITLFAPMGSGRIIAAISLLPLAIIACMMIKKRLALSMNAKQVLLLIGVIGLLYFVFYFVSGLRFGFTKTGYGINKPDILFLYIIPIGAIIVCNELIRHVLCVQGEKYGSVFAFFISLCADVIICATIPAITNMSTFMDVVGLTLLPGLLGNLLFNYLSKRYGIWPNIVYKGFTVWAFYLIPYGSGISNSLLGFINLVCPIFIFLFIDSLYEKKRKYALGKTSLIWRVFSRALTVIVVIIMLGTVMLISNQFKYGALVVATPSMTGELNQGDTAIFEQYNGTPVVEGQVIVYEKNGSYIIHRVADIQTVNGMTRYFTKGDANEDLDAGYITSAEIVGYVRYKIPYIGYPTLWLRSLFK